MANEEIGPIVSYLIIADDQSPNEARKAENHSFVWTHVLPWLVFCASLKAESKVNINFA